MREIIHLSLSAQANHLTTHYYNAQEQYFTYDHTVSPVDHDVNFFAGLGVDGRTETYSPRALLWDLRGGYGSLKKISALYETPEALTPSGAERVEQPRKAASDYVQALDQNAALPALSADKCRYWSDYCHVYFHPSSLLEVSNWDYDPVTAPKGVARGSGQDVEAGAAGATEHRKEFKGYEVGVAEHNNFEKTDNGGESVVETHFRRMLERCDHFGGINMAVDVDSAWGAFAAQVLAELRDDYVPKGTVAVWGLEDERPADRREYYAHIATLVELMPQATVYVPLVRPRAAALRAALPAAAGLDLSSPWAAGGLFNAVVETMTLPTRLRADHVSLDHIVAQVCGNSHRTIADSVVLGAGAAPLQLGWANNVDLPGPLRVGRRRPASEPHIFSRYGVVRAADAAEDVWLRYGDEAATVSGGGMAGYTSTGVLYPTPPSHPTLFEPATPVCAALGSSSLVRTNLLQMRDFVSRFVRSDDRELLKDQLETVAAEYEFGWSDGSDDDSD
ncbi:Misato segment II tubulin-like domain-containing protein [Dipodascopsis tothii]|uniref:Misato segment II tubulin-like domain-containing protein n=1 Tax=Dipodascopsis tothii TaxID=44089 RepID=UPI0034CD23C4